MSLREGRDRPSPTGPRRKKAIVATVPDPSNSSKTATDTIAEEFGANDWLIEEMYEQYVSDPTSVDPSWASYFESHNLGAGGNGSGGTRAAARASACRGPQPVV